MWNYFKVCEDEMKATCELCKTVISRGSGTAKSFTTTPLNNHLSYKHCDEYKQVLNNTALAATSSRGSQQTEIGGNQQTLADVISKKCGPLIVLKLRKFIIPSEK